MTALTAPRNVQDMGSHPLPTFLSYPIADNVKIFPGAMIALNATGYAQPATTSTAIIVIGRYEGTEILDNTVVGHAAGALTVNPIRQGVFYYNNSLSGDAIAAANRGAACYAVDDQTVALTSGGSTRVQAGMIVDVDSGGVFVLQGIVTKMVTAGAPQTPASVVSVPVPALSAIADAGVIARFTPGVAGRIIGTAFMPTTAVTTAAKATTLTPKIATVNVTGGVLSLTSANMTPIGHTVAGTTVTALNTFGASDEITVVASSTTAFVEGAGVLFIYIG